MSAQSAPDVDGESQTWADEDLVDAELGFSEDQAATLVVSEQPVQEDLIQRSSSVTLGSGKSRVSRRVSRQLH